MTKPNFVVITHPKSETLANCLSKQDKTFLSQVNKYLGGYSVLYVESKYKISPRHGAERPRRACARCFELYVILKLSRDKITCILRKNTQFHIANPTDWAKIPFVRLKCVKIIHLKVTTPNIPAPPVTPELVT